MSELMIAETPNRRETGQGADDCYVTIRAGQMLLAIPARAVQEMVLMPPVTAMPGRSAALRGVINLRGRVLPLLDLRVRLGMPSYAHEMEQFAQTLSEREQDHLKWIGELRASVDEKRAFTLARDPHKCKFGKWYDSFQLGNASVAVAALWRSFDEPHRRIHGIADTVSNLAAENRFDEARAVIAAARDTDLQELCRTFATLRTAVRETSREVAVILRHAGGHVAVSADEVMAAETIDPASIKLLPESVGETAFSLAPRMATRRGSKQLVSLVDVDRLVHGLNALAA